LPLDCTDDTPHFRVHRRKGHLRSLNDLDKRTAAAKKAHALCASLESDLGGSEVITTAQRELVQRAALLGAVIADFEVKMLRHEPVEFMVYLKAVGVQRRVLATIGLERRPRDVTPSLSEYLEQKSKVTEDAATEEAE
jgi:hypothetical protein